MRFKEATDRATDLCITLDHVASAVGRESSSVRKARLDPESPGYRPPPDGWQAALAELARRRAAELVQLAEELVG